MGVAHEKEMGGFREVRWIPVTIKWDPLKSGAPIYLPIFRAKKKAPRPSGVAELAVMGLPETRWQLNVDPSESH